MDIEFHYYMTYIIARRAGFKPEESQIIAYSSQYTDDNAHHLFIDQGTDSAYESYISQTMNILKPEKELMRIYPVFHFLPGTLEEICGDKAFRADGKLHLMNTIPDNQNGRKVLTKALETGDPCRIGIATHTYADTFAHQNFTGADDSFNSMAGLLEKLIPSIGHADAQHQPDIPNLLWWDGRLVPANASVNNKERFLNAAGCIFDRYRTRVKGTDSRKTLLKDLGEAIGDATSTKSERVRAYKGLMGDEFVEYDKKSWFDEAVSFKVDTVFSRDSGDTVPQDVTVSTWKDAGNFRNTKWFAFQEAVKAHQEFVLAEVMRPIYRKMGQTTW